MHALGGRVEREIPLIRGFSARVPRGAVRALRSTPGVRSVHADHRFVLRSTTDAPATASTTLDSLRATVGADRVTGGAADVALIDSGVAPDAALAGHVVNGPDFSDDARVDELRHLDTFGHGTHLASIIAAVAPQARVVNVKVADHEGNTSLGNLLAGIDWATRRGDRRGLDVRVLNLAFGAEADGSYRNDPLAYAVEQAWDEGLVVITSAGNGGNDSDGLDSPAYDPYVVAVGAEDSGATATLADDGMAPFSSRGSDTRGPDVVAPGVANPLHPRARLVPRRGLPRRSHRRRLPRLRHLTVRRGRLRRRRAARRRAARPQARPDQGAAALDRAPARGHRHGGPGRRRDQRRRRRGALPHRPLPPALPERPPRRRMARRDSRPVCDRGPSAAIAGAVIAGAVIAGQVIAGASNRWRQQPLGQQPLGQQPLVEQPLVEQPLVECRLGRGFVMSGRKWNPPG